MEQIISIIFGAVLAIFLALIYLNIKTKKMPPHGWANKVRVPGDFPYKSYREWYFKAGDILEIIRWEDPNTFIVKPLDPDYWSPEVKCWVHNCQHLRYYPEGKLEENQWEQYQWEFLL